MKKRLTQRGFLFTLTLLVILITAFVVWQLNRKEDEYKPGVNYTFDRAVDTALMVYSQQKKLKTDFSTGPCLSNDLLDDWVVDLVHQPRIPEDDLMENQCAAYLDQTAHHFVELNLAGEVVRIK